MKHFLSITTFALLCAACTPASPGDGATEPTWVSVQTGTGSVGEPLHGIMLMTGGSEPVFAAQCAGVVSPIEIGGADAAVRCWWAGGGYDFAAFKTQTGHLVRTRWVDEQSGVGRWESAKK